MHDRVALITGSRKGIGRALAERFCELGATVIGCSRSPAEWEHERYQHHCADISDEQAVCELMSSIRRRHGRLDILINNAGIAAMNHALLTPADQVQKVLNTNLLGCFLMCREGAKLLRKSAAGRIVNLSTVAVPLALEGEAAYVASKAGVVALTQVLAKELAPLRITVNAVGPTPIDTDLIRNVPKEKIDALLRRQAVQRLGSFDDIANVVEFFVRPQSDFVTGQTVYLGGVT
jgi:3-oxoacyl-[acyl-carrier protein] reductase